MPGKPTIHVIDDDEAVRDSTAVLLIIEGFSVRSYASAAAFLNEGQSDENGCLLVDMHMPGMDGLALLRQLRRDGRNIPAVVMTGKTEEVLRRAVGTIGAVLLEKPFRLSEVIGAINAAMARSYF